MARFNCIEAYDMQERSHLPSVHLPANLSQETLQFRNTHMLFNH